MGHYSDHINGGYDKFSRNIGLIEVKIKETLNNLHYRKHTIKDDCYPIIVSIIGEYSEDDINWITQQLIEKKINSGFSCMPFKIEIMNKNFLYRINA